MADKILERLEDLDKILKDIEKSLATQEGTMKAKEEELKRTFGFDTIEQAKEYIEEAKVELEKRKVLRQQKYENLERIIEW